MLCGLRPAQSAWEKCIMLFGLPHPIGLVGVADDSWICCHFFFGPQENGSKCSSSFWPCPNKATTDLPSMSSRNKSYSQGWADAIAGRHWKSHHAHPCLSSFKLSTLSMKCYPEKSSRHFELFPKAMETDLSSMVLVLNEPLFCHSPKCLLSCAPDAARTLERCFFCVAWAHYKVLVQTQERMKRWGQPDILIYILGADT